MDETDQKKPENEDDDSRLFIEAMSDVEPLKQDKTVPYRQRRHPKQLNIEVKADENILADTSLEAPEFFEYRRPGIQRRLFSDLQRGHMPPEDSLDLHGMRVIDAQKIFQDFINQCTNRGMRSVRIIHGKGRGSDNRDPVLKQKTYQWLHQLDAVLAFCTAPSWDGGSGATYVLLSRKFRLDQSDQGQL